MARFPRPSRAGRPVTPEVPYYAEGELVRERVVTETVGEPVVVRDDSGWLWLLLIPLVLLIAIGAYLLGRDDDEAPVVNQTPTVAPTVVITQAPAPPPVVINPPPVLVTQAPAPEQTAAPASPVVETPAPVAS